MNIEPFSLPYSDAAVEDLRFRLAQTRWPDEISGSGWEYGVNLDFMRALSDYWKDHFDWKAEVRKLSAFHHYRCTLDGAKIHFIHERGQGPAPIPLILTHGWPGSFLEMIKIIPLLTDPASHGGDPEVSFDVVVPSLPGFGFSNRPAKRGMNTFRVAELWAALMAALGYDHFAAQGGDFGAAVSTILGLRYPQLVLGVHLNYIPGSYRPYLEPGAKLDDIEQGFLDDQDQWYVDRGAYAHLQRNTPQTAAYGLNDSPAALAAWITSLRRCRFSSSQATKCAYRARSRISPKRRRSLHGPGSNADTTFSAGPKCRAGATSLRPKSLNYWQTISLLSSVLCTRPPDRSFWPSS